MDAQIKGIITLVSAALKQTPQQLPEGFDLENAYDSIIKHNIVVMALEGAALCGIPKDHPTMKKLFSLAFKAIIHVEAQNRAAAELFRAFEENNIDYLPLKGAILRGMYPKQEYRSMGDMDVLIRLEQREKIEEIMRKLGYSGGKETDHELIWCRDGIMFELHKHLIPSYNEDYYAYYGDGWKFAHKTDTSRYEMTAEDHFVFIFAHFTKHYRDGGVGIRQMCDLWIFRNTHPEMNEEYICAQLKELEMDVFYGYILQTMDVWFGEGNATERTVFISEVIYESGSFGKMREKMLASGARISGEKKASKLIRYKRMLQRVLLSKKDMEIKYSILNKLPILLPIMWIYRGLSIMIKEPWKIRKEQDTFQICSAENVQSYQDMLYYVGLKF